MTDTVADFINELRRILPGKQLYTDVLRRLAWGTDGSFYRLIPRAVVRSSSEQEVSRVLRAASLSGTPVTFRAAGTSLSGQAVSDSVLLVAGKNWEGMSYDEADKTVTLQPGVVGAEVNRFLSRFGRHFGPDPASIGSCMVGGIVANNASGMSCGVLYNSDRMLTGARIILADGTIVDTLSQESREAFAASHPEILKGLTELRERVLSEPALKRLIEYKYSIKNVTGLNLLPLVTCSDPFDILAHLMVGSEGTLGFLSLVRMKTLPLAPYKASAMIYFPSIRSAAEAVVAIPEGVVSAAELLDRRSLLSVNDPMATGADTTAVLAEVQGSDPDELHARAAAVSKALGPFGVKVEFSEDPAVCGGYWSIRSGIFPTVGAMRKEGTTCLIEDVAFHLEDLPSATEDLSALLDSYGYTDSCIYGHALAGNFHFIINQSFGSKAETDRYAAMIRDVAELVVGKYHGSLKAEHGTGRNMAPFVEYEWGSAAFGIMKEIKALLDPRGILNPGVIFNDDPECFVKNIKALPPLAPDGPDAYKTIDKCIECGFCEVNCTSCGFTLSSRTRIAVRREMARLRSDGSDPEMLAMLQKQYKYYGDETCAADGLCSLSCPMGINVADLTHLIREEAATPAARKVGGFVADHFSGAAKGVRAVLALADAGRALIGPAAMGAVGKGLHTVLGLPLWTPSIPKPYRMRPIGQVSAPDKAVYFPSCLNRMMGLQSAAPAKRPLVEETVSLLQKAGYEAVFPKDMDSLCCGMIWESKGQNDVADKKLHELEKALLEASEGGKLPVLCDQSPCLHRMKKRLKGLELYEPAGFISRFLVPRLEFTPDDVPVLVHLTCSSRLMGVDKDLLRLARMCSSDVRVPEGVGCCGFAGDKGMTHPELNAWSLRKLRAQAEGIPAGYSNSRTCEIGLETNSGVPYMSIVYLVNSHTRNK